MGRGNTAREATNKTVLCPTSPQPIPHSKRRNQQYTTRRSPTLAQSRHIHPTTTTNTRSRQLTPQSPLNTPSPPTALRQPATPLTTATAKETTQLPQARAAKTSAPQGRARQEKSSCPARTATQRLFPAAAAAAATGESPLEALAQSCRYPWHWRWNSVSERERRHRRAWNAHAGAEEIEAGSHWRIIVIVFQDVAAGANAGWDE